MKVSRNNTVYGLIGVLILFGLLATFGDFLPASGARTYEYSQDTINAENIYASLAQDYEEAKLSSVTAKVAYDQALVAENSIKLTLCSQQLVLAQLKYQDTDPTNTVEVERLTDSINQAKACLEQGF